MWNAIFCWSLWIVALISLRPSNNCLTWPLDGALYRDDQKSLPIWLGLKIWLTREAHQTGLFARCKFQKRWKHWFFWLLDLSFQNLYCKVIRDIFVLLFNHLGNLLFWIVFACNPLITGDPDGFSSIFYVSMQNSGLYLDGHNRPSRKRKFIVNMKYFLYSNTSYVKKESPILIHSGLE